MSATSSLYFALAETVANQFEWKADRYRKGTGDRKNVHFAQEIKVGVKS